MPGSLGEERESNTHTVTKTLNVSMFVDRFLDFEFMKETTNASSRNHS